MAPKAAPAASSGKGKGAEPSVKSTIQHELTLMLYSRIDTGRCESKGSKEGSAERHPRSHFAQSANQHNFPSPKHLEARTEAQVPTKVYQPCATDGPVQVRTTDGVDREIWAQSFSSHRTIVQPLNTETAMKKIEENNTLVFLVGMHLQYSSGMQTLRSRSC